MNNSLKQFSRDRLYRVKLRYACYGVITRNRRVVECAPIAAWMKGRDITYVKQWVARRGGTIKRVNNSPEQFSDGELEEMRWLTELNERFSHG